jgi:hypothetical protein
MSVCHRLRRRHAGDVDDHRHAPARLFDEHAHEKAPLVFGERLKLAHENRADHARRADVDHPVDLVAQYDFVDRVVVRPGRHRDGECASPVRVFHVHRHLRNEGNVPGF